MADENYQAPAGGGNKSYGYGKRPWWQWALIYIVIGGIAYGAIYYFFFTDKGGYTADSTDYGTDYNAPANTDPDNSTSTNTNQQTTNIKSYMVQNMKIDVLQEGTGEAAKSGDQVTVNYTGTLLDGTKFDSSLNPGREPFQFTIDESLVIEGWHLGVAGMKLGEKKRMTISS